MTLAEEKYETDFIQRINRKQAGAYHELFRDYYRSLVIYATGFVKSPDTAEDIVQETIVAMWSGTVKFKTYPGFRTFLYNSVRNSCLNHLAHQKVQEKYISFVQESQTSDDDDLDLMKEEIMRRIMNAVDHLPARCRQIFLMHMDGKSNGEIAEALDLSIETIKTQKKNALKQIRHEMGIMGIIALILLDIV